MPLRLNQIFGMAGSAALFRVTGKKRPLNVMISVTDRCNGACRYCSIPRRRTPDPSFNDIATVIDDAAAMGCRRIGIWGGEPLLRNDIAKITTRASQHGIYVTLDTNGKLITDRIGELEKSVDHFNVSLDGNERANDLLRGKGAFGKAVKALETLENADIPHWIITVLTNENLDQVDEILRIASETGSKVSFQFIHHNEILGNNEGLYPKADEAKETVKLILARKKEGAPVASSFGYLELLLRWPDFSKTRMSSLDGYPSCLAGKLYCNVDTGGRIYPCSLVVDEIDAPNVFETGFKDGFKKLSGPPCEACLAACFTEYNLLFSLDFKTGWNWMKALRG